MFTIMQILFYVTTIGAIIYCLKDFKDDIKIIKKEIMEDKDYE